MDAHRPRPITTVTSWLALILMLGSGCWLSRDFHTCQADRDCPWGEFCYLDEASDPPLRLCVPESVRSEAPDGDAGAEVSAPGDLSEGHEADGPEDLVEVRELGETDGEGEPDSPLDQSVGPIGDVARDPDGRMAADDGDRRGPRDTDDPEAPSQDPAEAGAPDRATDTAVVQLTAGNTHTCALLSSGAVRCWGWGLYGALGYGTIDNVGDDELPRAAGDVEVGGETAPTAVVAGNLETCATAEPGLLRCWGATSLGTPFVGVVGDEEVPSTLPYVDLGGPAQQVSVGGGHACVLRADGALLCFGANGWGQLGYAHTDTIGDDEAPATAGPVDVADVGESVFAVDTGAAHTCVLLSTSRIRCWGRGSAGQLGYPAIDIVGDDETPASVGDVDVGGLVTQVVTGGSHTCALTGGRVRCWGANGNGQLGIALAEAIGDDEVPAAGPFVEVADVGETVTQLAAGADHTCAILSTGSVRCWGHNGSGQLGYAHTDDIGDDESPVSAGDVDVLDPGEWAVELVCGGDHSCVRLSSGRVKCWGANDFGQLGIGSTEAIGDDETPASARDTVVF